MSERVDLGFVATGVVGDLAASPGAVLAASIGARRGQGAAGGLDRSAGARATSIDTPFDLASVTKPIVALTVARLVRLGALSLSEPLGDLLLQARGTSSAGVPLELLLAHRSGLEAHVKLYEPMLSGGTVDRDESLVRAAASRREGCDGAPPEEGFPPVYSDMGYLLLGAAVEARTGEALDVTVRREVLEPLGISRTVGSSRQMRGALADFLERVAPTEDLAFRGGVIRGVVHDENAWAISGDALSGHAGLFGDAESVHILGRAILCARAEDDGWLGPTHLAPLLRIRPGGTHLAGFDRKSGDNPAAGHRVGPNTFGHLGFTGTSLWIDPDARFVGVLLTNRVHPTRDDISIRKARPWAYDAMFDALSGEAGKLAP